MQDVLEFLRTRRTYRRFWPKPVPEAVLRACIEAARIVSCGANRQTLKYAVIETPAAVAAVNQLVRWAAYLPPDQGRPAAGQTPTAFPAVFQAESLTGVNDTDAGLALGSITAAAWGYGVGSCIMGAIDREQIKALLGLADQDRLRLHSVVALGYPKHESRVVPMENGSVRYYLDENRDYCVPKRPEEEILLTTV